MKKCSHHSCNREARQGRATCVKHGAQASRHSIDFASRNVASGLCQCGKPREEGYKRCERCRKRTKANDLRRRNLGICTRCQKNAVPGSYKCEENMDKARNREKARLAAERLLVFRHYGLECACCGEKNPAFLTIDHINGGGTRHRNEIKRSHGGKWFRWLIRNNFPPGYQTLCGSCNFGKRDKAECPHQEETRAMLKAVATLGLASY